jgi:hypothetical protein
MNVKWGLWERGQISGRDEADKRILGNEEI